MKSIIQIDTLGNIISSPIDLTSFLELNPDIDISNGLPTNYVWCVTAPIDNLYLKDTQKLSFTYVDTGQGYYQQTYIVIDKTPEEIEILASKIKDDPPFPNWIWNADTYTWSAPKNKPTINTEKSYYWNIATNSWHEDDVGGKSTPQIYATGITPKNIPLKVNVENKIYNITFYDTTSNIITANT
jgi:hypothetical protein